MENLLWHLKCDLFLLRDNDDKIEYGIVWKGFFPAVELSFSSDGIERRNWKYVKKTEILQTKFHILFESAVLQPRL